MAKSNSGKKGINVALWIVQVLLAIAFFMAGMMKLVTPAEQLASQIPFPLMLARFIGLMEVLGAVGMLVPALTRIKPQFTAFAGIGLATVMVLASAYHATRAEYPSVPVTLLLGALAAFVAWGRLKKAPIAAKR